MQRRKLLLELGCRASQRGWHIEATVRAIAGILVLGSALLGAFVSPWWLALTAFVGLNLFQSAITGWCLMSNLLALIFPKLTNAQ
jgi:hypothetical protein